MKRPVQQFHDCYRLNFDNGQTVDFAPRGDGTMIVLVADQNHYLGADAFADFISEVAAMPEVNRAGFIEVVHPNGQPVERNRCVVPDHMVRTFTVQIRSMGMLSPEQVQDQLQKKWEVINATLAETMMVVR